MEEQAKGKNDREEEEGAKKMEMDAGLIFAPPFDSLID